MRIIGSGLDFTHPKPDRTSSDDDSDDADDWVGERVGDYVVYHDFLPGVPAVLKGLLVRKDLLSSRPRH